jgi:hypothetical protein
MSAERRESLDWSLVRDGLSVCGRCQRFALPVRSGAVDAWPADYAPEFCADCGSTQYRLERRIAEQVRS